MRHMLFASLLCAGLSACSTTHSASTEALAYLADARLGEQVEEVCISEASYAYREGTDRTIIIETGGQSYLFETSRQCPQLAHAANLYAYSQERGSRCIKAENPIVATASFDFSPFVPASGSGSKCQLKAIYEWDAGSVKRQVASID